MLLARVFTTGAQVPDVRKRLEVPQMQFCVVGDVLVTMQRLVCMAIGLFRGFRRIFTAFFGLLSELRPCQFMTVVMWIYTHS